MFKLPHSALSSLRSNNRPLAVLLFSKCTKSTTALQLEEDPVRPKPRSSMVEAAFASLKPPGHEIKTPMTDDKIARATTVNELLSISEGTGVSRRHALSVVSTLAEWSSSGKAQLTDFENDARFVKLCRILTKGTKVTRSQMKSEDLTTVLGITADDEATRLVAGLSLSQAVRVMTALSQKKRRSLSLLRALAYNITACSEVLNLKEGADLLYSMCTLNFPDDNLVEKVCRDAVVELRKGVQKSAPVGSIITSLGLLKYKNCEILDTLSSWVSHNHALCRPQDVSSLFITLATVNYTPTNSEEIFKALLPQLSPAEAKSSQIWLNLVWALVVLNVASPSHISSVLSPEFVKKVEELGEGAKTKLLNVNSAAELLIPKYEGDRISPVSELFSTTVGRSKEKLEMVDGVVSALKNLIQAERCFSVNVNTGLGVFIDVKCLLDRKCRPLPLQRENEARDDVTRVAILAHDYHSMCRGDVELSGASVIASRLLEAKNYKVLNVPYSEFKSTDKLLHRVRYLEAKLKEIVK